jgi:hypothetical protein
VHKEYKVTLIETKQVSYLITAASPEDAENIAEDLVLEGEEPIESERLDLVVDDVFVYRDSDPDGLPVEEQ